MNNSYLYWVTQLKKFYPMFIVHIPLRNMLLIFLNRLIQSMLNKVDWYTRTHREYCYHKNDGRIVTSKNSLIKFAHHRSWEFY